MNFAFFQEIGSKLCLSRTVYGLLTMSGIEWGMAATIGHLTFSAPGAGDIHVSLSALTISLGMTASKWSITLLLGGGFTQARILRIVTFMGKRVLLNVLHYSWKLDSSSILPIFSVSVRPFLAANIFQTLEQVLAWGVNSQCPHLAACIPSVDLVAASVVSRVVSGLGRGDLAWLAALLMVVLSRVMLGFYQILLLQSCVHSAM